MSTKVQPATEKPKPPNAGKGRKKGVPNKSTQLLKDAILDRKSTRLNSSHSV